MAVSKWGRCPWSYEFEKEKIYPEDLEKFKPISGPFAVFECIGTCGEYIIIKSGDNTFRVKPEIFRELTEPKYKIGDTVKIKDMYATILFIEWHNEKTEHYYYITVNGKRKSRRYFESELSFYSVVSC